MEREKDKIRTGFRCWFDLEIISLRFNIFLSMRWVSALQFPWIRVRDGRTVDYTCRAHISIHLSISFSPLSQACKDKVDAICTVFSFDDPTTLSDAPQLMNSMAAIKGKPASIVIGTRYNWYPFQCLCWIYRFSNSQMSNWFSFFSHNVDTRFGQPSRCPILKSKNSRRNGSWKSSELIRTSR